MVCIWQNDILCRERSGKDLMKIRKMTFSYMEEKCYFRCLKSFIHEDVQSVMKLKWQERVFVRYVKTRCMWQENRHVKMRETACGWEKGILHRLWKKHHVYTQGKAVFVYEGGIRNSMYRFKYGNKREYAEFMRMQHWKIWSVAEQNKSRSADSHSNVFPEEATARIQSGRSICAGTWKKSRDFSGWAPGQKSEKYNSSKELNESQRHRNLKMLSNWQQI